jgi:hypothetical protein
MNIIKNIGLLLCLCFIYDNAQGEFRPSFDLNSRTWHAAHILIATEGDQVDGVLTILEVWSGNANVGEEIVLSQPYDFKIGKVDSSTQFSRKPILPDTVMSQEVILFLCKDEAGAWTVPPLAFGGMTTSMLWIEDGLACMFTQLYNPGPSVFLNSGQSKSEVKSTVDELLTLRRQLDEIGPAEADQKPTALQPFIYSKYYFVRYAALNKLEAFGSSGLHFLQQLVEDDALAQYQGQVVATIALFDPVLAGPVAIKLIAQETSYWQALSGRLSTGWWTDSKSIDRLELQSIRWRYARTVQCVRAISTIKYLPAEDSLTTFMQMWQNEIPNRLDQSSSDQMLQECLRVLKSLED